MSEKWGKIRNNPHYSMKYPIKSQNLCHEHIDPPMMHEKWKIFANKREKTPKNGTKCSTGVINTQRLG